MIFGIHVNTTCDISKLSQISLAEQLVKLRITILKYHPWYLCQISLQINVLPIQTILIVRSLKVRIVTELTKAPNFAQRQLIAVPWILEGAPNANMPLKRAKQDLIIVNFSCWGPCVVLIKNCYLCWKQQFHSNIWHSQPLLAYWLYNYIKDETTTTWY